MNRAFLSALMIVSLVSALVSPACAFVNGSMDFIEICTSNGDVQTIAVAGDQSTPQQRTHKAQPDCAFCFATSNVKPMVSSDTDLALHLRASGYIKVSSGVIVPHGLAQRPYQSRAPPIFI